MSWVFLLLAGFSEIFGVICMKNFALGVSRLYFVGVFASFALSLGLLYLALKDIPMSVAYAIYTGMGASFAVLIGIMLYRESASFVKLFFVGLIILCSVSLKLLH